MKVIIDTNVPLVANGKTEQASPECRLACTKRLSEVQQRGIVVLDNGWHILREYQKKLNGRGQPGVGDAFLKWLLTNWANPKHCKLIAITPLSESKEETNFAEFPDDPLLMGFDPSDRKFVAVAMAHPEHPPILNATDTDWQIYHKALEKYVQIEFLCPEMMERIK